MKTFNMTQTFMAGPGQQALQSTTTKTTTRRGLNATATQITPSQQLMKSHTNTDRSTSARLPVAGVLGQGQVGLVGWKQPEEFQRIKF